MANIEAKIVLTGGPCAGKTTALARIEEYFTELGYKVLVVSESATELIKGGARPFGNQAISMVDFQDVILKYQLNKENSYDEVVTKLDPDTKVIIVYDRGLMDNSAYVSEDEFHSLLHKNGLQRLDLLDRYDMVLHLVTAADGASNFYTLDNNAARSEGIEEAIALDRKTMNAWGQHQHLVIIDNSLSFEDKLAKVISEINNILGHPASLRYQRKYLVDNKRLDLSFLKQTTAIQIRQIYLGTSSYEHRLRKRMLDDEKTYYYTVQKHDLHGTATVLADKKITEKEYERILATTDDYRIIDKTRYTFIWHKKHFRLDLFDDGVAILEVSGKGDAIPPFIPVIREITDDEDFYNVSLAHIPRKDKQYKK